MSAAPPWSACGGASSRRACRPLSALIVPARARATRARRHAGSQAVRPGLVLIRRQPRRLGLLGAADVRCMPDLDGAETPAIRSVLPNHAAVQLDLLALVDRAATKAAVTVLACNRHRWLFPATPGTSQRDGATLGRLLSPVNSGCVTPQPVGGHLDQRPPSSWRQPEAEQGGGPALGGWHVGGPSLLHVGRQKNGPIH
jgi:hypothetical protein